MIKKLLCIPVIFLLCFLDAFSQPGAVHLKDGSNNPIGSFNSISAAYASIPGTLSQSYVIELSAAYDGSAETYPITLTAKAGAGPSNTITIRPEAGVLSVSITSTQPSLALIELNDADYVIIDGRPGGTGSDKALLISNMGTPTASYGVELVDGACNNVIRYCRFSGYTSPGSGSKGIYIGASATNPTGNSDNRFEFLTFDNGPRYHMNSSGTPANPNRNLFVYGCEFKNLNFAGWWQQNGTGKVTVDSCFFFGTGGGGSSGTGAFGILSDFQTDTILVTRNNIYNIDNFSNSTDIMGMSFRSFNPGSVLRIFNNFIHLNAVNATTDETYGIAFGYNNANNPYDAMVYHNTIVIGGTASGGTAGNVNSAAIAVLKTDTLSKINIRNNILINQRTGGQEDHLALSRIATLGSHVYDYNNYVSTGASLVKLGTTLYPDLASYQAAAGSNESNSKSVAVSFVSSNDLHLAAPSSTDVNLQALSIAEVTHDYDGDLRVQHFMGADEPSGAVGIGESLGQQEGIILFPNPAQNTFTIRTGAQQAGHAELFDLNGKLICRKVWEKGSEQSVDVRNLTKGVYFVKVYLEDKVFSERLVILP